MNTEEERQRHGDLIADYAAAKSRLVALRASLEKAANEYLETAKFILTAHPRVYENITAKIKGLADPAKLAEQLMEASEVAAKIDAIRIQLNALGLDIESPAFLDPITRVRGL